MCDLRRVFLPALLAGIIVRAVALPLPGTTDVSVFKIWSYNAATLGPTQVYGIGGSPPRWRMLTYNGNEARVDYPPLALYELAVVGRLYSALFPSFPDGTGLTIVIKCLPLLAELALTALILAAVSRVAGAATGQRAVLAYWANPAVILLGAVLGYFDALCALPAVGALLAASAGVGWAAGILLAVACLTKPQGLLVAPAVFLALFRPAGRGFRVVASALVAGALVTSACVWPIIRAGAFPNMLLAVGRLLTDGNLSANAANLWWVVTYAGQIVHRLPPATLMAALARPVEIAGVRSFLTEAGANSSLWMIAALAGSAWTAVAVLVAWAMWKARGVADFARLAALAALTVHAYFVLSVQVHENHLSLALPLLAVVASIRPQYWSVLLGVSAIAALNVNLFYGLGDDVGYAIPRGVTGIDATVILAILNCVALVWHAAIFRRECASEIEVSPKEVARRRWIR